jgi:uroporphyrinogen-III synthase
MADQPLAGVHVLVTRPRQQSEELVAAIARAGGDAIRFPVIEIVPREASEIDADVAVLSAPDIVIFVSRNAVVHGLSYSNGAAIAVVGPTTAATVEAAGKIVDIRAAEGFDSEHLLAEPALADIRGKVIRIIRGNGGRGHLADVLIQRGATVQYLPVYARRIPSYSRDDGQELERRWRSHGIDVVTVMSVESLTNLVSVLPAWCRDRLPETPLVTPATRVLKEALNRFPACRATLARGPQTSDIIEAIVVARQTIPGQA